MNTYTENNMPELPREVGSWIELTRIDVEGSKPTWRVRFENAVGGSIGYRFRTKRAAVAYRDKLALIRAA